MSPFAAFLRELRKSRGLLQAHLAAVLGYEQTYVSALEVGSKGVPAEAFLTRLTDALALSEEEQEKLRTAAAASQRKIVLDSGAPQEAYWLLKDLREQLHTLSPSDLQALRAVLGMKRDALALTSTQSQSIRQEAAM